MVLEEVIVESEIYKTPQQKLVEQIDRIQETNEAETIRKLKSALLKKIESGEIPIPAY